MIISISRLTFVCKTTFVFSKFYCLFFFRNTTHVIFSNGTQSTYNKAKQLNIPIVSILWIEACKKQLRLVDPVKYSIHNVEQYEHPELYKKVKVNVKLVPILCRAGFFTCFIFFSGQEIFPN